MTGQQAAVRDYAGVDLSSRNILNAPELWTVGDIVFARQSGRHIQAVRSKAWVEQSPSDSIKVAFSDAGQTTVQQDDRETRLEAGDFTLLDASRPYRYGVEGGFRIRMFQFPKTALGISNGNLSQITATALSQEHALSAYLIPFLNHLSVRNIKYHPSTRMHLARNVTDILATLINDRLNDLPLEDSARRALVVRIKAFIIDNLDNVDLSPELIATAHFISVRYLHKLFAGEEMTVSRWTLAARLDRCRRDLASGTADSSAIFGVARQWGFSSPAHFSRAFRASFGMSPRDWQARSRLTTE
jgi:AraC-like DNA-binding protein